MSWIEFWKRRGPLVYAVGVWTVLGSVLYYSCSFIQKSQQIEEVQLARRPGNETSFTAFSDNGLTESTVYRPPGKSFSIITTSTYRPDFVPYTTRFEDYIKSFFDNTDGKEK